MLKVLVVDDDILSRRRIRQFLKGRDDVVIVSECEDGAEAVRALRHMQPDLLLLDVQLPDRTGYEVVEAVGPEAMPTVVFLAEPDPTLMATLDEFALDYLDKPVDQARLYRMVYRAQALQRGEGVRLQPRRLAALLARVAADEAIARAEAESTTEGFLERIQVKLGGKTFFVTSDEIDWIEAAGNYVRIHAGTRSHLVRDSISGLEERLDPDQFRRIHRSTIVRVERIQEVRPWFSGEMLVLLRDGTRLKLSRNYRKKLEEMQKLPI